MLNQNQPILMNFSKKNCERPKGNTFFTSQKISFITFLILLIFVSSCTNDEMPIEEREQPATAQQKALSPEEINAQIEATRKKTGSFDWKEASDLLIWSAAVHGGDILAIGYGNASFSETKSSALTTIKSEILSTIAATDQKKSGEKTLIYEDEILNFIENAIFNDINLLDNNTGLNIIDNIDGDTLSLTGQNLITDVHSFLIAVPTDATGAGVAQSMISTTGPGSFITAQTNLGFAMGDLGAELRRLDNQMIYIGIIKDANEEGLGAIVDADLAKESARLQSLQVRQQLGSQTLAIANANPQILLSFFG